MTSMPLRRAGARLDNRKPSGRDPFAASFISRSCCIRGTLPLRHGAHQCAPCRPMPSSPQRTAADSAAPTPGKYPLAARRTKRPLVHARMRQPQIRHVADPITEIEQIEIDRARGVARVRGRPAESPLRSCASWHAAPPAARWYRPRRPRLEMAAPGSQPTGSVS